MTADQLTTALKEEAHRLGFDLAGVCPAVEPPGVSKFREWLQAGYAGEMQYLADRADAYTDPNSVLDGARSILMLAMNYHTTEPKPAEPGSGLISRYAWGAEDYHDVIHAKLKQLASWLRGRVPKATARGVVDTAPLLEREFAQLAGLGWIGKNTLLLNRAHGSWFFLAALLTDQELAYDKPHEADHCGTCSACIDACPTDAFPQPYVLDATRCISYLTIELRGVIPVELRDGIGDWLFGCDICEDVCPWNNHAPSTNEAAFEPQANEDPTPLAELFDLTDDEFRARFGKTPLWRSKRRGILRNAAIVLGNQRHSASLPALGRGLQDDDPLVRCTCAWALGRIQSHASEDLLRRCLEHEMDDTVRKEIQDALQHS